MGGAYLPCSKRITVFEKLLVNYVHSINYKNAVSDAGYERLKDRKRGERQRERGYMT